MCIDQSRKNCKPVLRAIQCCKVIWNLSKHGNSADSGDGELVSGVSQRKWRKTNRGNGSGISNHCNNFTLDTQCDHSLGVIAT